MEVAGKAAIMDFYKRENYLRKIRGFYHDCGLIKAITGLRRCGKSCLMQTIADELLQQGIPPENIIRIDLDRRGFKSIRTPEQLEQKIDSLSSAPGIKYLFIDEVQNVKGFEEIINAFRTEGSHSIFITGSNSYLLSGEMMTKLTGRYIEFEMFPLTFEEYEGMKAYYGKHIDPDMTREFDQYIIEGGFPKTIEYDSIEDKRAYAKSVISEIFAKDISRRIKIRNRSVFDKVQRYVINNFGATVSIANIATDLARQGISVKRETLHRYIKILEDAKIIYECKRFDLKSRRSIRGEQKYYLADMGIYFASNTDNRINYGPVLENIIYIYARSLGYEISIGRIGRLECDFILRSATNNYAYVQSAMTIMSDISTENREYAPLEQIKDNYPKFVMTRNDMVQHRNGIRHVNIPDFIKKHGLFE